MFSYVKSKCFLQRQVKVNLFSSTSSQSQCVFFNVKSKLTWFLSTSSQSQCIFFNVKSKSTCFLQRQVNSTCFLQRQVKVNVFSSTSSQSQRVFYQRQVKVGVFSPNPSKISLIGKIAYFVLKITRTMGMWGYIRRSILRRSFSPQRVSSPLLFVVSFVAVVSRLLLPPDSLSVEPSWPSIVRKIVTGLLSLKEKIVQVAPSFKETMHGGGRAETPEFIQSLEKITAWNLSWDYSMNWIEKFVFVIWTFTDVLWLILLARWPNEFPFPRQCSFLRSISIIPGFTLAFPSNFCLSVRIPPRNGGGNSVDSWQMYQGVCGFSLNWINLYLMLNYSAIHAESNLFCKISYW